MADKTFVDYVNELLDLIPALLESGLSIKDAIAWIKDRLDGKEITDADWEKLRIDHDDLKARLKKALAALQA